MKMNALLGMALATAMCAADRCPMPPQTAEEALDLAERTYAYVAKSVPEKELAELRNELDIDAAWLKGAKDAVNRRNAERAIRSVRRKILFRHPDLQFKRLLAVQRGLPFSQEAGTADQNAGRWSSPGPGLIALDNWKDAPRKTVLLEGKLPKGTTLNPDLNWDGERVVFAFNDHTRAPEADPKAMGAPPVVSEDNRCRAWIAEVDPGNPSFDAPDAPYGAMHHRYFIYEAAADGSWVRQITGRPDDPLKTWEDRQTLILEDADPCYLPDGGILFHSTRSQTFARCHSGRYVPAWLLYRCDGDGRNIRQLSWGEANEWEPTVLNDGIICYTRWDYINRHAVWFSSLWTTKPDGTSVAHYYGNYSKTIYTTTEPKAIPGSTKIVATASSHHMFNCGSLVIIDTSKGEDGEEPLTRLTPEADFPEAGSEYFKVSGLYKDAMPVNDTLFFASYSPDSLWYPDGHPRQHSHSWTGAWPHPRSFGIWLVDTLGGRELIYQDWEWGTFNPLPVVKRPRPPALASVLPPADKAPDTGLCYVENIYDSRVDLPKGCVKAIRVNRLFNQGAARHFSWNNGGDLDIYKEALGTVPVAPDGSATFRIPAETPIQLQAIDTNGVAVLTMRSFIYAQKGEVQGCVGCHEQKNRSGATAYASKNKPKGTIHDPVPEVDLGYHGPFSFVRSVQPIFDRKCIGCHGLGKAKLSLIGEEGLRQLIDKELVSFAPSYQETMESKPYDYFAAKSPLFRKLESGHGPKLTAEERATLILWMDENVPQFNIGGGYNWDRPELRETDPEGEKRLREAVKARFGEAVAGQPFEALVNRGDEAKSRVLMLLEKDGTAEERAKFLALCRGALRPHATHELNGTCNRTPCVCNSCWVRKGNFNKHAVPRVLTSPLLPRVDAGTPRRFVYSDFMKLRLVYVDEANESHSFEAGIPHVAFDLTRWGESCVIASQPDGWRVYELPSLKLLKEFHDPARIHGGVSVVRKADGRTFVFEENGRVHEYAADDTWSFTYTFAGNLGYGRCLRFTTRGTAYLGVNAGVVEVKLDRALSPEARVVRILARPDDAKSIYQAIDLPDGNILASSGYLPELLTYSPDGKILARVKAAQPKGLLNYFYGGFCPRPNGNILLTNWTGHGEGDFKPGWKILEFDPLGNLVWKWNNPLAGTPCAVVPLN